MGENIDHFSKQSSSGSRVQGGTCEPRLSEAMGIHQKYTLYTHIYGEGVHMADVNRMEQITRFVVLRQGERENINVFKLRYDNQIIVNEGVGKEPITDSLRAMEFIYDTRV